MRTLAPILIALACGSLASAQNYEPLINGLNNAGDYFRMTFQDEFNGNALDQSKWTHTFTGKRWDANMTPDAVSVGNGVMTIKSWSENTPSGRVHNTGAISTHDKWSQTYGYYEARMDFNGASGLWSAFWIHSWNMVGNIGPDNINRPDLIGAEIDVVEHRVNDAAGSDISSGGNWAVHWNGYGPYHQSHAQMDWGHGLANGYHTFGLLWLRDRYEIYYDGDKVGTFTNPNAISSIPEFIILSTEINGATWAGRIPAGGYGSYSNTNATFNVDYVRAYALNADAPFLPEPTLLTGLAALSVVCRRKR